MLTYFAEMSGISFEGINEKTIIYLIIVNISGMLIFTFLKKYLAGYQMKRKRFLNNRKNYQAINSSTPQDNPILEAKQIALDSVDKRFSIFRRLILTLIIIIWFIALIFPFLGNIPATAVSLLIASSSIIFGIAAKPFIENTIAGLVITFSGLITAGDTIRIDDNLGTIEDITTTHTVIKIWDWRRYVIPNSKMVTKEFINYTLRDNYIWTYIEFWVTRDCDLDFIKKLAIESTKKSPYFASYEEPTFWVMDIDKEGIKCWIAGWADSPANSWELKSDTRQELSTQLRNHGIEGHRYNIDINSLKKMNDHDLILKFNNNKS